MMLIVDCCLMLLLLLLLGRVCVENKKRLSLWDAGDLPGLGSFETPKRRRMRRDLSRSPDRWYNKERKGKLLVAAKGTVSPQKDRRGGGLFGQLRLVIQTAGKQNGIHCILFFSPLRDVGKKIRNSNQQGRNISAPAIAV